MTVAVQHEKGTVDATNQTMPSSSWGRAERIDLDSQEILAMADERFERRLAEESAAIRHEIAALRAEMATRNDLNGLRQEMNSGFTRLYQELATTRVEMMKWSFMFWTGQCLAILGFLFVFLRNR